MTMSSPGSRGRRRLVGIAAVALVLGIAVGVPSAAADPPTLTGVPADMTVEATSSSGATVNYATPGATDENTATVDCVPASGSVFAIATTIVTCTATDTVTSETASRRTSTSPFRTRRRRP